MKQFPGVRALDGVNFDVRPGEVHVLIGENGAGKSTLSKILMGVIAADEGEILFEGRPIRLRSPLDARQHGIGGVYQEFMLVPWLNVAQNIFLNREPRRWKGLPFVDHRRMHEESREILSAFGLEVDTRLPVKHLDTALQQMVEISKVLSTSPRVLVLDEPTAMLTDREVSRLFERIEELRRQGVAIVYISHRLQEIRKIGDRVTVLRDGRYVGTVNIRDVSDDQLVEMMVGRSISQMYPRSRRAPGAEALRLQGFSVKGGPQEADFVVRYGEIVGLAGLVGAGRTELVRGIFGIDPIQKGELLIDGRKVTPRSPNQMIQLGVGLLSEDRKRFGLALKSPVHWNTVMASLRRHFPRGVVRERKVQSIAREYVEKLRIVTPSVLRQVRYLSGGNQQKVVMAKWLDTKAKILIFDEPTRGIDVGAKAEVHALMDQLAQEGNAIIMISSDLPEVLGMSDRIYVLFQKRIVGEFKHGEANQEKIASLMLGIGTGVKTNAS
ncbi:MAG: sugar ABC transporter ATP-binding protein [Bacillota bacterium]|nr:sugar ABC transporter ATP-binding protein [Bacillota bacterium]